MKLRLLMNIKLDNILKTLKSVMVKVYFSPAWLGDVLMFWHSEWQLQLVTWVFLKNPAQILKLVWSGKCRTSVLHCMWSCGSQAWLLLQREPVLCFPGYPWESGNWGAVPRVGAVTWNMPSSQPPALDTHTRLLTAPSSPVSYTSNEPGAATAFLATYFYKK